MREMKRNVIPMIVTTIGILLAIEVTVKEGGVKTNFEKNHPLIIVPTESRSNALLRLLFSSPIGESADTDGFKEKQKNTIRNLYTAVSIVAITLSEIPREFRKLALVASSIRSLE